MRHAMVMARRHLHFEDQRFFFRLMMRGLEADIAMILTPLQVETLQPTVTAYLRLEQHRNFMLGKSGRSRWLVTEV
jgi:uncharacterized protein YehS (DUF1456 family)